MKIQIIKLFDAVIGRLLCFLLGNFQTQHKKITDTIKRILVIRPGGIGDAILLIPSLKRLREQYPDTSIDILAEKRNGAVFQHFTQTDNLYRYDDIKNLDLVRVLRNKYDAVIDTEQWHRSSSVISYLTRAPLRSGFGTNTRKGLFTDICDYSLTDYEADSFLKLFSRYVDTTIDYRKDVPFIKLSSNDFGEFKKEITSYSRKYNKLVGIFPGATVRERKWGVTNYALLAERMLNDGTGIVLLGGPGDQDDAALFKRILFDSDILDYTGKTTLPGTAAVISMLDLFLSADTGLMHIAYGVGTKTVSLFGAGIESKWAPKGKDNIVINKYLFCSPCTSFGYTPSCPYHVRCLREISVDEVYDVCTGLL